jgi:predicted porin
MGYGLIDEVVSNGSPADMITNIMVFNAGVEVPLGKLTLMFDIWNANLAEDNASDEKDLGTEFDLAASYQMKENLKLQAVAAYLAAGDATGGGDEDPTEVGVQMSLSF